MFSYQGNLLLKLKCEQLFKLNEQRASDVWKTGWAAEMLSQAPEIRGRFLHVGCGNGEAAMGMARQHPQARITALEFSPSAIRQALAGLKQEPPEMQNRIQFQETDLGFSGIAPADFDACLVTQLMEIVENPGDLLHSLRCLLPPQAALLTLIRLQPEAHEAGLWRWVLTPGEWEKRLAFYGPVASCDVSPDQRFLLIRHRLTRPRVVGMMRVRNGEPFLSRALDAAAPLVEAFVVLNDGSTDKSADICRAHPKVKACVDQSETKVDEARDKNRLLKLALDLQPDWILGLDADEEIESGGCEFILDEIASAAPDTAAFSFDFPAFWNDERHYRFDGPYARMTRHARLFRVRGAAPDSLRFEVEATKPGSGFHGGSVPQGLAGCVKYLPVKFKHYGYLLPELRRQKYDFYIKQDEPVGRSGYYEHLVNEDRMVLLPWHDRAEAFRSPRPVLPSYYFHPRPEVLQRVPLTATRILELGCAAGELGKAIKERQICHLTGLELNPTAAQEALKYFDEVLTGDLETADLPFADGSFDCVICADVLEHLRNPWAIVEKLYRWLAPGGLLVCSIPNIRNLAVMNGLSKGQWFYEDAGILDRTHLRFFTLSDFEQLLKRAGFNTGKAFMIKDSRLAHVQFPQGGQRADLTTDRLTIKGVSREEFEEWTAVQFLFAVQKPVKDPVLPATAPGAFPAATKQEMLVTIVMPVFNQAAYTLQCFQALAKNTPEYLYDGVIVDNASTDQTPVLLKNLTGDVQVIRNQENLGFAKACNQGAKAASRKYLLFLNNDTLPLPGWLEAMLACLEQDETIGAVCAKLVYPNGTLQEAGGIIFSDGSSWNFGRGDDPAKPAYGQTCEVDYGSGACLLVRRKLFERLGGFDELFAPAFYEDVDLGFGIRRLGHKVMFCPQAVVIHFEGMTTGRVLSAGFKQCQARNQRIFVEKWQTELGRHAQPPTQTGRPPATADRNQLHGTARLRPTFS